jgi:Phosphate transporter family
VVDVARKTGGALTLFAAHWLGIPAFTAHTITGTIVGVGAAGGVSAVRWNLASDVVTAGALTLPAVGLNFRPHLMRPCPLCLQLAGSKRKAALGGGAWRRPRRTIVP